MFSSVVGHSSQKPATNIQNLVILNHKTHSEEVLTQGQLERSVHVVVKGSPFFFTIGNPPQTTGSRIDFNQIAFEGSLVYDCEPEREVDYVRAKPLDFKPRSPDGGITLEAEIRIKVLSSQHEDMCFRVKIKGYNPITKEEIQGITLSTPPIKVISKPEQIKKREPSKKRSISDTLMDCIHRIEKHQEESNQIIERIFQIQSQKVVENKKGIDDIHSWDSQFDINTRMEEDPNNNNTNRNINNNNNNNNTNLIESMTFEESFVNLLRTYEIVPREQKLEMIRNAISGNSIEKISEFLDLFWSEGLQKEPSLEFSTYMQGQGKLGSCNCTNCPHEKELEQIHVFYTEFLAASVTPQHPPNNFYS